jgi:hypothetical protein
MNTRMTAEPAELRRVAHTALAHAERVTHHTALLGLATRDRPLGHGHYGELAENAIRPLLCSLVDDLAMTIAGVYRSLGEGLLLTAHNIDAADEAVRHDISTTG